MTTTHLLYLHGFRSSPQSAKARMVAEQVAARYMMALGQSVLALVAQGIAGWPRTSMAVVGSSLGGFYASWVARQAGCPSVLLNPAVDPARDLARHIGEHTAWHNPEERFFFLPEYVDELRALDQRGLPPGGPELAVIAKGDEVLDWQEMLARYPAAQLRLLEGGDHGLSDFADHLPTVLRFLDLH